MVSRSKRSWRSTWAASSPSSALRELVSAVAEGRSSQRAGLWKLALRYAAWSAHTPAGRARHRAGILFKAPAKLDYHRLVPVLADDRDGYRSFTPRASAPPPGVQADRRGHRSRRRARPDQLLHLVPRAGARLVLAWIEGKRRPAVRTQPRSKRALFAVTLAGCPLEEKISEFQKVKSEGRTIGALAIICVDNPMTAATGHRICNDCMKSCIYQKQEPVNIPQAETRTLKDVLELPWGFEIYSLLTRWNPLDLRRPDSAQAERQARSHRRDRSGGLHACPSSDERRPSHRRHRRAQDRACPRRHAPVSMRRVSAWRFVRSTMCAVSMRRSTSGRWPDSAVLPNTASPCAGTRTSSRSCGCCSSAGAEFQMFGGVRFGGTLSLEDAFELGFDHVALCAGAGKPTVLDLPNGLARGVRTASDFLMALQLTGAAKRDSVANLQIRLPAVVVGGGLTAIDTATETLAYYPVQVEKFLARFETLVAERGKAAVRAVWNAEETAIADEFIEHARAIRAEREAARSAGRERAHRRAAAELGRSDHRLSQASHRQPVVHAESRGSGKGARRRHPLRRRFDAAGGGGRRLRTRTGAARRYAPRQRHHGCAGAHGRNRPARTRDPGRGGNATQHRARARRRGPFPTARQVLRRLRRER